MIKMYMVIEKESKALNKIAQIEHENKTFYPVFREKEQADKYIEGITGIEDNSEIVPIAIMRLEELEKEVEGDEND